MHTNAHSPFGFYLSSGCSCSAAGNLFYLNGTSLRLSPAHLLTWYSAVVPKQNYHCMGWGGGWRGGGRWGERSFSQMITHSHMVLQFSDYRDTDKHTYTHEQEYAKSRTRWNSMANWNHMWASTSRSFPFDAELWDKLTSTVKEKDGEQREEEKLKRRTRDRQRLMNRNRDK